MPGVVVSFFGLVFALSEWSRKDRLVLVVCAVPDDVVGRHLYLFVPSGNRQVEGHHAVGASVRTLALTLVLDLVALR